MGKMQTLADIVEQAGSEEIAKSIRHMADEFTNTGDEDLMVRAETEAVMCLGVCEDLEPHRIVEIAAQRLPAFGKMLVDHERTAKEKTDVN